MEKPVCLASMPPFISHLRGNFWSGMSPPVCFLSDINAQCSTLLYRGPLPALTSCTAEAYLSLWGRFESAGGLGYDLRVTNSDITTDLTCTPRTSMYFIRYRARSQRILSEPPRVISRYRPFLCLGGRFWGQTRISQAPYRSDKAETRGLHDYFVLGSRTSSTRTC